MKFIPLRLHKRTAVGGTKSAQDNKSVLKTSYKCCQNCTNGRSLERSHEDKSNFEELEINCRKFGTSVAVGKR